MVMNNQPSNAKFVFVLKGNAFDLSWPEGDRDPNHPPPGRDLVEYLKAALVQRGSQVQGPFEGEGGWTPGRKFSRREI